MWKQDSHRPRFASGTSLQSLDHNFLSKRFERIGLYIPRMSDKIGTQKVNGKVKMVERVDIDTSTNDQK